MRRHPGLAPQTNRRCQNPALQILGGVFDGGVGSMTLGLTASRLKMGILASRLPLSDGSQQPYSSFVVPSSSSSSSSSSALVVGFWIMSP